MKIELKQFSLKELVSIKEVLFKDKGELYPCVEWLNKNKEFDMMKSTIYAEHFLVSMVNSDFTPEFIFMVVNNEN